ncbi:Ubiquitin carboxyl-terminal hydrolase 15 [Camellia lanceoleosa]|uniref:Ubiquitin carboxyl-terminal hydrolase 15 n=1 Tax=Camellia lanceoleosa TaxID=1840588 RepID=A0ACC0GVW3_9ERIC|nr:Ubiquitin carboxyl-terminal hydrolase 15 [Camellia lanceoleosa]
MFTIILRNCLSGAGQKRHNISGDVASFSCKLGMSAATVIPLVHASKNGIHECARCFGPATSRCSRCKAVRYWYDQTPDFWTQDHVGWSYLCNFVLNVC